jgi:hypothetical protein
LLPTLALADSTTVASTISLTQSKILQCFSVIKDAEAAGANISSLTATLNQAGQLLDHAKLDYSSGNLDAALNYAQQSQDKLNSFLSDASILKNSAAQQQNLNFWLGTVGSIAGTAIIVAAGILIWLRSQRKNQPSEVDTLESS